MARLLLIALVFFAGCATTNIVMKNPKDGRIIVCSRPTFGELRAAENCAEALERDGWIRLK